LSESSNCCFHSGGVQAVTFEFENIPFATAQAAAIYAPVRPSGDVLHISQHRLREKTFLHQAGFPVTPFHVVLTLVNISDDTTVKAAEKIYAELGAAGLDVLMDDRDLRPGPKFKDAELIGVPVRVTLGERNLKDGNAEIFYRLEDKADVLPLGDVVPTVTRYYAA